MSSAVRSTAAVAAPADPGVPYPLITEETACRTRSERWFPARYSQDSIEQHQARNACLRCLVAEQCLLWALANPELSEHGIWAATSPKKRTHLRTSLVERLGADWVAVVVAQRRARDARRRGAARVRPTIPLTAAAPAAEPAPEPVAATGARRWEPVTAEQAAHNRAVLLQGLRERRAA